MIALAALRSRVVPTLLDRENEPRPSTNSDGVSGAVIEALDLLDCGVLLVDAEARVRFINSVAQKLVRSRDLGLLREQLRAASPSQTANLHDLIARCARRTSEIGESGATDCYCLGRLTLQFVAMSPELSPGLRNERRLVAIFVTDPDECADPTPHQLQLRFGLTPAEADLASEIVKGKGLTACAKARGISRTTASTHLQHIFEKTGTRRQAELVRLILRLRPAIRPTAPAPVLAIFPRHAPAR